jgi:hypothetical protein
MDAAAAVDRSSGKIRWKIFLALLIGNLALLSGGVLSTFLWRPLGVAGMAGALVAIGIFTYLMLFVDSGDIRSALTAAFVFVYFSIMGMSFHDVFAEKMSGGFGKIMFDNFATLLGVILGFYFAGKALEKAAEKLQKE